MEMNDSPWKVKVCSTWRSKGPPFFLFKGDIWIPSFRVEMSCESSFFKRQKLWKPFIPNRERGDTWALLSHSINHFLLEASLTKHGWGIVEDLKYRRFHFVKSLLNSKVRTNSNTRVALRDEPSFWDDAKLRHLKNLTSGFFSYGLRCNDVSNVQLALKTQYDLAMGFWITSC